MKPPSKVDPAQCHDAKLPLCCKRPHNLCFVWRRFSSDTGIKTGWHIDPTWICLRGPQKIKKKIIIDSPIPKWWIFHWEKKKSPTKQSHSNESNCLGVDPSETYELNHQPGKNRS